ncbi:MAG: type II toxin-antitoxin system VapC family toxin [Candidatus Aenigmarchaeota archaeon]|nr:type II toxin-antitoxin system VapC family toxin [Candidatus Aenigmarchaeota archaeon]
MTKIIYLDTNIYLDYYFDRHGSKRAFDIIFFRAPNCEFKIVVSDWVLRELELNGIGSKEMKTLFSRISENKKLVTIFTEKPKDIDDAKKISSDHFQDPLHVILAKKGGAEILITRNVQDFNCCRHLLDIKFPEDI